MGSGTVWEPRRCRGFPCGREVVCSGDPTAERCPTLLCPSCSELIAEDIHFISSKRHLEREKPRKGERQICKHLAITRVMLGATLGDWLLGEGTKLR